MRLLLAHVIWEYSHAARVASELVHSSRFFLFPSLSHAVNAIASVAVTLCCSYRTIADDKQRRYLRKRWAWEQLSIWWFALWKQRWNRDFVVATHLFTFLNHFNLWTLTSACRCTCNLLFEYKTFAHTHALWVNMLISIGWKNCQVHAESTRTLQSSISALCQYSVELVHFLQMRTWPILLSVHSDFLLPIRNWPTPNTTTKNIIWNDRERGREKMAIDRPTAKKVFRRKQFFFRSFVRFCLRMSSKNQIKFNKKGKHISHNWA